MSEHTKKEIVMIADATSDASELLDMAYELLTDLQSQYFDTQDSEELIMTATYYPEKLRATLMTIEYLMFLARGELAVFGDPKSPAAQYLLEKSRRFLAINNTYNV